MKFKTGDKVKVIKEEGKEGYNSWSNDNFGCVGMITIVDDSSEIFPYLVEFDNPNNKEEDLYNEDELELVSDTYVKLIEDYVVIHNTDSGSFALNIEMLLRRGYEFYSDLKIIIDSNNTLHYIRELVKYNTKGEEEC